MDTPNDITLDLENVNIAEEISFHNGDASTICYGSPLPNRPISEFLKVSSQKPFRRSIREIENEIEAIEARRGNLARKLNLTNDENASFSSDRNRSTRSSTRLPLSDITNRSVIPTPYTTKDHFRHEHANELLRRNGFEPLPEKIMNQDIYVQAISRILESYEKMDNECKEWKEKVNTQNVQIELLNTRIENVETMHRDVSRSLENAEDRIQQLKESQSISEQNLKEKISHLEFVNHTLKHKMTQWTHKYQTKEKEADSYRDRLHDMVKQAEKKTTEDRQVFMDIAQRPPSTTGNKSVQDNRTLRIISMYEKNRRVMESDLSFLRREVANLNGQLFVNPHDKNPPKDKEDTANKGRVAALEKQTEECKKKNQLLIEENENLKIEIRSLPTLSQWRQEQEKRRQAEEALKKLINGRGEERTIQTTRDKIQHDKLLHKIRQKSNTVPDLVWKGIVEDLCVQLGISDVTVLCSRIDQLIHGGKRFIELESFFSQVQEIVQYDAIDLLPQMALPDVIRTLWSWTHSMSQMKSLKSEHDDVMHELKKRKKDSKESMGVQIRDLVELEDRHLASGEMLLRAEEMKDVGPAEMYRVVVRHVQELFGIPNVEGILPGLSSVFRSWTEAKNALKALRSALGKDENSSFNSCLNEIERLLDTRRQSPETSHPLERREEDLIHHQIIIELCHLFQVEDVRLPSLCKRYSNVTNLF
ncbi:hypothetical protein PROFUN_09754 [Planoprotostelium fungivorum]|uniref:Centrosomal protein of 70 kDa n=1 Tax=Planoprotostelium fungivorum TaxID=1890364 RepID=A0A2P6NFA5_9EUKA|nr:hypothetical protein PROFUN_09754 [Planoprotostelium fungivorum]